MTDIDYRTIGIALALCAACVLIFLVKRQQSRIQSFEQPPTDLASVPFEKVEQTTPEDETAYHIIEEERKKIWNDFSDTTLFSIENIFSMSKHMTHRIASVYFPGQDEPIYQATVEGLIHLITRVSERLEGYLNKFPLAFLKERTVHDIVRLHRGYKKVAANPVVKFFNNTYVDAARRLLWYGVNATNPWYYGRQIVWTAGKEVVVRYLLTLVITIVGEEAVLLYRKSKK